MSAGWLLDGSALAVAHHPAVAAQLAPLLRAGVLYTCPMLDIEALAVADTPAGYRALADRRGQAYRSVPVPAGAARRAAGLAARLARKAHYRVASPAELLIAATAIEHGLAVVHYHPGFQLLGELGELDQHTVAEWGSLR